MPQPAQLIPYAFTSESASALSKAGNDKRWAKHRAYKKAVDQSVENPIPLRLALIEEQIARTRIRLNSDDITDKDRAALLRAIDALIERERILRQIPGPPKCAPARATRMALPDPVIPPSCGPAPTSNSVPVPPANPLGPQDTQKP